MTRTTTTAAFASTGIVIAAARGKSNQSGKQQQYSQFINVFHILNSKLKLFY